MEYLAVCTSGPRITAVEQLLDREQTDEVTEAIRACPELARITNVHQH